MESIRRILESASSDGQTIHRSTFHAVLGKLGASDAEIESAFATANHHEHININRYLEWLYSSNNEQCYDSVLSEKEQSTWLGPEMHQRIPAHMWCITMDDLDEFMDIVSAAHESGQITNDIDPSTGLGNSEHDNPAVGPNLHAVTKYVVIPRTRAAGGMSWALMKHPDGLPIDTFVTHCWSEGIFEFYRKVQRYVGRTTSAEICHRKSERKLSLWCCVFANPQSWGRHDLKHLLGANPAETSPFARALLAKDGNGALLTKEFWVFSNHHSSIYTRLWCVLELMIAIELELDFLYSVSECSRSELKPGIPQLISGFQDVRDALCSDSEDQEMILKAIAGKEDLLNGRIQKLIQGQIRRGLSCIAGMSIKEIGWKMREFHFQ